MSSMYKSGRQSKARSTTLRQNITMKLFIIIIIYDLETSDRATLRNTTPYIRCRAHTDTLQLLKTHTSQLFTDEQPGPLGSLRADNPSAQGFSDRRRHSKSFVYAGIITRTRYTLAFIITIITTTIYSHIILIYLFIIQCTLVVKTRLD